MFDEILLTPMGSINTQKDTIDTNTNALMSIPNYIPNKAEYNGQEITLKHIIKK